MRKLCKRCFTMKNIRGKKELCKRCEEEFDKEHSEIAPKTNVNNQQVPMVPKQYKNEVLQLVDTLRGSENTSNRKVEEWIGKIYKYFYSDFIVVQPYSI